MDSKPLNAFYTFRIGAKKWSHPPGLNRRPADYESAALPTELGWLIFLKYNNLRLIFAIRILRPLSVCHNSNRWCPRFAILARYPEARDHHMLVEQQIAERRERARDAIAKVLERPSGEPYGDYRVKSASGKIYRVAMRGPGLFENYCACPDFAVNTLGTCKHIEALLLRLRKRHGHALESKEYARSRASISLQYGETIDVRLRLPAVPPPDLRKLARQYSDAAGLLRRSISRVSIRRSRPSA